MCLSLAVRRNLEGREVEAALPGLSQDNTALLKQEPGVAPASSSASPHSDRQSAPESVPQSERQSDLQTVPPPGELWELLQQQDQQDLEARVVFTLLKPTHRILLAAAAVMILGAAVIICRRLRTQEGIFGQESNIFLLFGFFGSIAAMFVACAWVGNLYLHLVAAACTAVSGFTITAFLTPQFTLTRRWVVGPAPPNPSEGVKNDSPDSR